MTELTLGTHAPEGDSSFWCVCVSVGLGVGVGGRVCVCLGGEGSERIRNKCEKGKGKEGERRLSASVMNHPSAFGYCVVLCKGHPP